MLTSTVPAQQLKPVSGRYPKTVEAARRIELSELAEGNPLQVGG